MSVQNVHRSEVDLRVSEADENSAQSKCFVMPHTTGVIKLHSV